MEVAWIEDDNLRMSVQQLLDKYPDYLKQPSSISGKYHRGENRLTHIRMALKVLNYICKEFNITGIRRDKLFTAIILHDIGYVKYMKPGKVKGWKYYEATGWSRESRGDDDHPILGFEIIMEESNISDKHRIGIANMVLKHMSIWYNNCPNPKTEDEKWIAVSDFLASRDDIIFKGLEVEDWKDEQSRNRVKNKSYNSRKQRIKV